MLTENVPQSARGGALAVVRIVPEQHDVSDAAPAHLGKGRQKRFRAFVEDACGLPGIRPAAHGDFPTLNFHSGEAEIRFEIVEMRVGDYGDGRPGALQHGRSFCRSRSIMSIQTEALLAAS